MPLANPYREEIAHEVFREYTTMSPEEWAARHAHEIGGSSFDECSYQDPVLHDWIQRLHAILRHDVGELEEWKRRIEALRHKYLTEDERRTIADAAAREW